MSKTCLHCTLPCIFVLLSNYLREYFFPLICLSCGIRGNTNVPAQHIRNTRKPRVPSDRETIHRHFSLASTLLGKRKTKHWERNEETLHRLNAPLTVHGNQRAFFYCPVSWHCTLSASGVSLIPVAVKYLQTQTRDQIYGLSMFTGLQEYPRG